MIDKSYLRSDPLKFDFLLLLPLLPPKSLKKSSKMSEKELEKSNPSIKKFFQKAKSFWKN